jgi:hypothetical protein
MRMQVNVLFKIPGRLEASGVLRLLNSEFWLLTPDSCLLNSSPQ